MKKIIMFVQEQWREIGVAMAFGLILTRSLYNHLDFWQLGFFVKLIYILILFIIFSLVIYFLLFHNVFLIIKSFSRKQIFIWLILSFFGGALLITTLPVDIPIPGKQRVLEIIATGEKNPVSSGSDVALVEFRDINGNLLSFEQFEKSGDWIENQGALVSRNNQPAKLTYIFDAGQSAEVQLLFNAKPDAGMVEIHLDEYNQVVDLFEEQPSETLLFIPVHVNLVPAIGLFGVDIAGFGLILFIVSVWFFYWYQRQPKRALVFLIFLGALSIFSVALSRPESIYINKETPDVVTTMSILPLSIAINVVLMLLFRRKPDLIHPLWYGIPMLIALFGAFFLLTDWNRFLVAPDSYGYVNNPKLRPPVYPMLVNLATTGTDFDHNASKFEDHTPVMDTDEPLMRVSRVQKLFLFTCSIILVYALSYALGFWSMPLNALFMLWLYFKGFFPLEMDYILVEAVAQGWLFLLLAAMLAFFRSGKAIYILLSGVLVALLYLTRSASAYAGIIVLAVVLWAVIKDWRKYWKVIIVSGLLALLIVLLPIFINYSKTGAVILSPQYASSRALFAIQVAEHEDSALMPDDISKEFLNRALARRQEVANNIREEYAESPNMQYFNTMTANVWQVAYPAANELTSTLDEAEALIYRVSNILLQEHQSEYIDLVLYSLELTIKDITRLKLEFPQIGFWHLLIIGALLCLVVRGMYGYAAGVCLLSHLSHIVLVCFNNMPETRHIYASEFLLLLAYYLLLWGIIHKIADRMNTNVSSENDLREVIGID